MADEPNHVQILVAIAHLEEKLDGLIKETAYRRKDHEHRIRGLEQSKWRVQGMAAIVATFAGGLISYLLKGNS
jgi:hypothetical protein